MPGCGREQALKEKENENRGKPTALSATQEENTTSDGKARPSKVKVLSTPLSSRADWEH